MFAPASRSVVTPLSPGQGTTSGGRSMGTLIRRIRRAMAIRLPVLPQETAATASPDFTASMAFHIEAPLPLRTAVAGFSSEAMTLSV